MAAQQLVNGASNAQRAKFNGDNLRAWEAMADEWETYQTPKGENDEDDDGNDMFTQCLLPAVDELADFKKDESVLDLGAGSGIIARRAARKGAHVVGLDFSQKMIQKGIDRTRKGDLLGTVEYDLIDLMDFDMMKKYMDDRRQKFLDDGKRDGDEKFDVITISTTLKSLPDLDPVAKALPLMLKPDGRIVIVDLHPIFSKPAGHRGMEIYEDPDTGKQQLSTYIKVPRYLKIEPSRSEAVRGQPEPLWVFHRPLWSLMDYFFKNHLVLDAMREPAFEGEPVLSQAQSYHNFPQTPMLLAFRLRHRDRGSK